MRSIAFLVVMLFSGSAWGQSMELPESVREWYRNPDGSCVQCSLGMAGAWVNLPQATTLLWDTSYGPAERGGSWPERVSRYAQSRQIPLYNVTGEPTIAWMEWAMETGRGCGAALGIAHFQTVYGRDKAQGLWYVVDNNSPRRIDVYTDAEFYRLHRISGLWCVVLDTVPGPSVPQYHKWW